MPSVIVPVLSKHKVFNGCFESNLWTEVVKVNPETSTLATITYQNYFRLYKKLSGMTGTAKTEETEFNGIYNLDVVKIPTNKPCVRIDEPDIVYRSEKGKLAAIIEEIKERHEKGQPILVGTVNIDKSEEYSRALTRAGVKHTVLNAKNHAKEADIVAQAGRLGAVTIATNMAGRGTDIILGGNPDYMARAEMRRMDISDELIAEATGFAETDNTDIIEARKIYRELEQKYKDMLKDEAQKVRDAGGLFIIGTERHESRRIDNQLRGRAGRQGDPGRSKFYLSAEDELLRLFAGDRFYNIIDAFPGASDLPIEAKIFSNTIENAQKKVEGNHFAARRNVLKFDDVMNEQRKKIYEQRNQVLDGYDIHGAILKMFDGYFAEMVDFYCPASQSPSDWNRTGLIKKLNYLSEEGLETKFNSNEEYKNYFHKKAMDIYNAKYDEYGEQLMAELERKVLLHNVDQRWMDHLDAMDELKRGIYLRSYAQQDPVVAFRMESYDMFDEMTNEIREGTVDFVLKVRIRKEEPVERKQTVKITATSVYPGNSGSITDVVVLQVVESENPMQVLLNNKKAIEQSIPEFIYEDYTFIMAPNSDVDTLYFDATANRADESQAFYYGEYVYVDGPDRQETIYCVLSYMGEQIEFEFVISVVADPENNEFLALNYAQAQLDSILSNK